MNVRSERFQDFVQKFTSLIDRAHGKEAQLLSDGRKLLSELVRVDDWLHKKHAQPDPQHYQQYPLHADPPDRFPVVSSVWGPGQKTPIHNHTVRALIGMLRGGEEAGNSSLASRAPPWFRRGVDQLEPGVVENLSPATGDIHRVSNLYEDRVSISVHVHGGNIGKIARSLFDAATGIRKTFISAYSNEAEISAACRCAS